MSVDLFLYAVVAAGLVIWLRNILGTRHGEESERSHPFAVKAQAENSNTAIHIEEGKKDTSRVDFINDLSENPTNIYSIESKNVQKGLVDIVKADKSFELKGFLEKAQDAFVIIVKAFSDGDRDTLEILLDKKVLDAFNAALDVREDKGYTVQTDIHAIRKVRVLEATLKNKRATIALGFMAEESSVTRDEEENIVEGHPDRVIEMRDIWVFSRSLKSSDPRWLVVETRKDTVNDRPDIPNTEE